MARKKGKPKPTEELKVRPPRLALASGVLALFALVIYTFTLCPGLPPGDGGELISAAQNLGVTHPPGYPTYTMLAKLFTFIPIGSIGWRVNFLSAVSDAATSGLLSFLVGMWTGNLAGGLLAGGLFAFAPLVWTYAVVAEVFGLNNFFLVGALLLATLYSESRNQTKYRLATLFWLGLALTHHHTFIFYALGILGWIAWRERAFFKREPKQALLGGFAFLLGFLPYLYLPLASLHPSIVSWGDQTTFSGFMKHFLRSEYGTLLLGVSDNGLGGELFPRLWLFIREIPAQLGFIGVFFLGYAWFRPSSFKIDSRVRNLLLVFTGSTVLYLLTFCELSNLRLEVPLHVGVQARFWQQALICLFIWTGIGYAAIAHYFRAFSLRKGPIELWAYPKIPAFSIATVILILLFQVGFNYRKVDQRKNTVLADFAHFVLDSLPVGSILISKGDYIIYPIRYVQSVENYRKDVALLDLNYLSYPWMPRLASVDYPDIIFPKTGYYSPYSYNMKDFFDANIGRRPIFGCNEFLKQWDHSPEGVYFTYPHGFLERILPDGGRYPVSKWSAESFERFNKFDPSESAKYSDDRWEWQVQELYWEMYAFFSTKLENTLKAQSGPTHTAEEALEYKTLVQTYERLIQHQNAPKSDAFKSLGTAYERLIASVGNSAPDSNQLKERMMAAWKHYLELAPPTDPDLPGLRAKLTVSR